MAHNYVRLHPDCTTCVPVTKTNDALETDISSLRRQLQRSVARHILLNCIWPRIARMCMRVGVEHMVRNGINHEVVANCVDLLVTEIKLFDSDSQHGRPQNFEPFQTSNQSNKRTKHNSGNFDPLFGGQSRGASSFLSSRYQSGHACSFQ